MTGWKGKVGGIGAMLGAVAGLLNDCVTGTLTIDKLTTYAGMFSLGLAAFGIRDAIGRDDTRGFLR